jgi:flagellar hook-length control protein FliK
MTPQVAAAPIDGAAGGKDLPGGLLPSMLSGAVEVPFSSALAVLQSPLLATDSQGKAPASEDAVDQTLVPVMPVDPATAALAAVLQWLRQASPAASPVARENHGLTSAPAESMTLLGADAGAAAVATTMPALVASHFKSSTKAGSGAAAEGNTGGSIDSVVRSSVRQDKPGSQVAAVEPGNSLLPDLRGLANLLNLSAPEAETIRPRVDGASGVSPDPLATTAGTPAPVIDNLASAVGSAVSGGDRVSGARAEVATPGSQSERVVSVPVHDRRWSQAIAAQVLILADHRIEGATLRLTPEHLGPVEVRIDFQDSQVNVNFGAAHSDTRAALEQALPRLREVLAGAGLTLGEASVQQQMRRGPHNRGEGQRTAAVMADQQPVATIGALHAIRMIDEYA